LELAPIANQGFINLASSYLTYLTRQCCGVGSAKRAKKDLARTLPAMRAQQAGTAGRHSRQAQLLAFHDESAPNEH